MFLYVAFLASLIGADAAINLNTHTHLDFKKLAKYAHDHKAEATAPNARNLRDMVKPDDFVAQIFSDSGCSIVKEYEAVHGNVCYTEVTGTTKFGCTHVDGILNYQVLDYGAAPNCHGEPTDVFNFPMTDNDDSPVPVGGCVNMGDGDFLKISCSGKDPFRNAGGLHTLVFGIGQDKECHARSIKTNRPHEHFLIPGGVCVSQEPGTSIMAMGCGAPGSGEYYYAQDNTGENCANLGERMTESMPIGCNLEPHEDDDNTPIMHKYFCVDDNTPDQK